MAGQSVREIKRRIVTVENTRHVTKAMEMVAAAKLRRAQQQLNAARPFSARLKAVLGHVAAVERKRRGADVAQLHPLLEERVVKRVCYMVITADRGMAGAYNSNVIHATERILQEEKRQYDLMTIGRKGRDALQRAGYRIVKDWVFIGDEPHAHDAKEIADLLMDCYLTGKYDEIRFIYNEFISAVTQRVANVVLLPLSGAPDEEDLGEYYVEYSYEPSPQEVLNALFPRYVENQVFRILLESAASEHGARRTAMRNASDNATELISELTLSFHRARQAAVTREITEIMGGAEALNGE